MNSFKMTRSTGIVCHTQNSAIAQAMDILIRDQMNILTGDGPENAILLTADATLPPESWVMDVTPEAVRIRYADDLGAVYALLHISEKHLGVTPFFWWNDQPLPKMPCAEIPCGREVFVPAKVKYRGWFINDEVLLDPWKKDEQAHREVWRMVFETILRCGGNMCIPGTDRHGDGLDMLAASMGLILPQHHAELLGAEMFGRMLSRRQGSSDPRVDAMPRHESGENGIYYHASFYDLQAANHITQLQVPPSLVAEELNTVLANGADTYWIINSGCIKPHAYILDLIREAWQNGHVDVEAHAAAYARTYFGSPAVAPLLTGYGDCAAKFGPHADSVAGDQYYHHAARILACHLMRGETGEARDLIWAERGTLCGQAHVIAERCRPAIDRWETYLTQCEQVGAALSLDAQKLLQDSLIMNAQIHLYSSRMMVALADALTCCEQARWDEVFFRCGKALLFAEDANEAMHRAEYGNWVNYYGNDCFVKLGLTCDVLRTFRGWLRCCHDGPNFWDWERKHLMPPAEKRIILQTHRHCQYTDDELCARLEEL